MYSRIFHLQADLHKALAHPKRLEIIHLLRDQELSVSEMITMLGLPQPNLSQHLHILREHNLVETRRDGKAIYYKLDHTNIIEASDLLRQILIGRYRGESRLTEALRIKMSDLVPLVKDPVCNMRLSPKTASYALKYGNSIWYFCAEGCKRQFKKNPKRFITSHHETR